MDILKYTSILWALLHALVLFLLLFEPRYSKKKTLIISLSIMLPLIAVNLLLFTLLEPSGYGTLMLQSISLPSMIVFWFLSKYRDGRFFFTFCLVDTLVLEIVYVSSIINSYTTPDTFIVMFVLCLVLLPLHAWLVITKFRTMYLEVQQQIKTGWTTSGIVGILFYLAVTLLMTYPTEISKRPGDLPALCLLLVLMPVIYTHIIITLRRQQQLHESTERENILKLQVSNMTDRVEELNAADSKFRMERHNFRHKLKTIASLVETKQYDELSALLEEYSESIKEMQVKRYCKSPVIDAVLSTYLQRAENRQIKVTSGFAFPDPIPCSETELATVLANALENAIHACEKLEPEKRQLTVKVLDHPRFIIQIANSFDGKVEFNEKEIPITRKDGHGFGTRSIAAFCEKNKVFYRFKADKETFTLYLNF